MTKSSQGRCALVPLKFFSILRSVARWQNIEKASLLPQTPSYHSPGISSSGVPPGTSPQLALGIDVPPSQDCVLFLSMFFSLNLYFYLSKCIHLDLCLIAIDVNELIP